MSNFGGQDSGSTTGTSSEGVPDQYVVLMERVINSNEAMADENRALRELLNQSKESITRLESRLERSDRPGSAPNATRSNRRTRRGQPTERIPISPTCRVGFMLKKYMQCTPTYF